MTRRRNVTEQAAAAAIEQGCRMLRLPTIRDRFAEIGAAAEREQLTYLGFLSELVIAECDDRTRRRAERRVRDAGFPRPKRLEEFSFEANSAINPAVIGQLASCAWVARSALSTRGSIAVPAAGGGVKSMASMLMPVMETWSRSIDSITEIASPRSPEGSAGRVSQTLS